MDRTYLKIGFWNINGISEDKISDDLFHREIENFDIVFISETWQTNENIEQMKHPPNYIVKYNCRSKGCKKRGRFSGGILWYYRKSLKNKISLHDKSSEGIL